MSTAGTEWWKCLALAFLSSSADILRITEREREACAGWFGKGVIRKGCTWTKRIRYPLTSKITPAKQNAYLRATEKLLSGVSSWSTSCGRSLYPMNVPSLLSKKYLGLHVFMYSPRNPKENTSAEYLKKWKTYNCIILY